jgi:TonB family protein
VAAIRSPLTLGLTLSAILHVGTLGLVGADWLRPEFAAVSIALAIVPPDERVQVAEETDRAKESRQETERERVDDGLIPAAPPPPGIREVTLDKKGAPPGNLDQAVVGEGVPLDTEDPRYVSYFQIVKAQLLPIWASMGGRIPGEGRVTLRFTIMRNGSLGGYEFLSSSGARDLDRIAVAALQRAAPFYPLPEAGGEALPVIVEFVY